MKLRALMVILLGALVLGACSSDDTPKAKLVDVAKSDVEVATLDLQLPVLDGYELWKSSDYQGKPVLVAVMATWCPWCKRSLPALDQTSQAYAGKVEVVGVFDGTNKDEIRKVKQDYQIKSKILYNGELATRQFKNSGFPYIVLFDKNHRFVRAWEGYSDTLAQQYAEEIDKLLKK